VSLRPVQPVLMLVRKGIERREPPTGEEDNKRDKHRVLKRTVVTKKVKLTQEGPVQIRRGQTLTKLLRERGRGRPPD